MRCAREKRRFGSCCVPVPFGSRVTDGVCEGERWLEEKRADGRSGIVRPPACVGRQDDTGRPATHSLIYLASNRGWPGDGGGDVAKVPLRPAFIHPMRGAV